MQPHDQLTIFRNRHRARELRLFRELVESYFLHSERDANDVPMDYEAALHSRSRVNQMLPRIVQIVRAAGLGGSAVSSANTDPGIPIGRVEVLHRIFSARYGNGLDQEIFDVIDMALGVYEGGRYMALGRTVNPLHYASLVLAFVGRAPKRFFSALGLWPGPRRTRLQPDDLARLEAIAARLADAEDIIDSRFVGLQDRQAMRLAEVSNQMAELAERLDFAERVLAQQRPSEQVGSHKGGEAPTPL